MQVTPHHVTEEERKTEIEKERMNADVHAEAMR